MHWRTIATHDAGGTLDTRERFYHSPDWQLIEQHTWDSPNADPSLDGQPSTIAQQFWGKRGADDAVARRVDRGDGSGGLPDGDYADAGDGSWYYVTDNLRSVAAVVNAAGSLVERVVYGPFGKSQHHFAGDVNGDGTANVDDVYHIAALTSGGATPDLGDAAYEADCDLNRDGELNFADVLLVQAGAAKGSVLGISHSLAAGGPGNPIGYAGYLFINDFGGASDDLGPQGSWYARHRFYDPVAGRWITRDPAGYVDGMSLYLYVHGNPFGLVDPLGLVGCKDPDAPEWNHLLPHQVFDGKDIGGLDIDSKEFGLVMRQVDHTGADGGKMVHDLWNSTWQSWYKEASEEGKVRVTADMVRGQLQEMKGMGVFKDWLALGKQAEHGYKDWGKLASKADWWAKNGLSLADTAQARERVAHLGRAVRAIEKSGRVEQLVNAAGKTGGVVGKAISRAAKPLAIGMLAYQVFVQGDSAMGAVADEILWPLTRENFSLTVDAGNAQWNNFQDSVVRGWRSNAPGEEKLHGELYGPTARAIEAAQRDIERQRGKE